MAPPPARPRALASGSRAVILFFLAATIATADAQAQVDQAEQDRRCALNRSLADLDHFQGVAAAAQSPVVALNAIQTYQCYGLFSLIADHAPSPELQTIGRQLFQTGTSAVLMDMHATSLGLNAVTFAATFDFVDDASARYFWLKHHATSVAQDQNVKLAETADAEDYLTTAARCFAVAGAMQAHQKSFPEAEASQLQEIDANDPDQHERIMELGRALLFGYDAPSKAAIDANVEVAARLAPVLKISLMRWSAAGGEPPVLYGAQSVDLARRGLDRFCPSPGAGGDAIKR